VGCTFCRIVHGELTKTLVDEGPHCLVILDRNQAARGHLLIIPRRHVTLWHELEPEVVTEMTEKAHRWAAVLAETLRPDGYNLLMNNGGAAGQDVPHAHLHITPRSSGDGYYRFGGRHEVLAGDDASALGERLRQAFAGSRTKLR
jgi:histidine triad (HIT) family protein